MLLGNSLYDSRPWQIKPKSILKETKKNCISIQSEKRQRRELKHDQVFDDDDVELNVLGCWVDIFGTNCDQCVCMVQCYFMSTETIRLIRMGSPGRPPRLSHSS